MEQVDAELHGWRRRRTGRRPRQTPPTSSCSTRPSTRLETREWAWPHNLFDVAWGWCGSSAGVLCDRLGSVLGAGSRSGRGGRRQAGGIQLCASRAPRRVRRRHRLPRPLCRRTPARTASRHPVRAAAREHAFIDQPVRRLDGRPPLAGDRAPGRDARSSGASSIGRRPSSNPIPTGPSREQRMARARPRAAPAPPRCRW